MAPRSQTGRGGSEGVDQRSRPAGQGGGPALARRCAYAVLRRVFEQGAYADRALQGEARELDSRDRALAMRLAYGTIQRRGTLDHVIERLAGRPPAQLDAPVLAALRLGLYEMLYTSGAPDHAIVADAVELSKRAGRSGHGLVNAVLRRAAREGAQAQLRDLCDDTPEHAAVMHSHPEWIARMWWDELGAEQARALMDADNEPGELALRVNSLRAVMAAESDGTGEQPRNRTTSVAAELGIASHTDPEIPEALVLDAPFDLHRSPAWREGRVLAQSRAAMLVSRVLDPQPGERILDLCAAPGGKTTHIAALMQNQGEIVAVERNAKRASELRDTARRLGADIVRVEISDAALPRAEGAVYDRVLVDPPCSGLGTLAAHPDLRWRVTPEQIAEMVKDQAAILSAGALALRPGGTLVYSTCTISADENEREIERFLDANPGFALDDLYTSVPAYAHPTAPGALLTLPHRDRTAGFFIARLRRGS